MRIRALGFQLQPHMYVSRANRRYDPRGPEVGFEKVEPYGIQNSETLPQVCLPRCLRNTQNRSRSLTASRLASIGCSETSSRCENRWKHGREGHPPKRRRFLIFHTPGKLIHHARRTSLRLQRSWNQFGHWQQAMWLLPLSAYG